LAQSLLTCYCSKSAERSRLTHSRRVAHRPWAAVDLDAAELTFGGSTALVHGQRIEGTTKDGRSRISLDRDTVTVLREHRRSQAEERLAAGSAWTDTGGLVFTNRWGEALYRHGDRAHDQADQPA
jgi:hypothetical protein